MGFFEEQAPAGARSPEATSAGVRAVTAVVLLVLLPQVWWPVVSSTGGLSEVTAPMLPQLMTFVGAVVPGIIAYTAWRRRAHAPLWVQAVAGGSLLAATIVGAIAVLGVFLVLAGF